MFAVCSFIGLCRYFPPLFVNAVAVVASILSSENPNLQSISTLEHRQQSWGRDSGNWIRGPLCGISGYLCFVKGTAWDPWSWELDKVSPPITISLLIIASGFHLPSTCTPSKGMPWIPRIDWRLTWNKLYQKSGNVQGACIHALPD